MKDTRNALANFMFPQNVINKIMYRFIKTYESLPQLWDSVNHHYYNQTKRNKGYDELLKILKKWNPAATRSNVRRKINCLRVNYNKELKKLMESKTVGPDGTETYEYVPTQWKFHALKFLSKNDKNPYIYELLSSLSPQQTFPEMESEEDEFISYDTYQDSDSEVQKETSTGSHNTNKERISNKEYKAIGANVALKLQRMAPDQQWHAELLINKVLINGLKNNLTDETDLTDLQVLDVKSFQE